MIKTFETVGVTDLRILAATECDRGVMSMLDGHSETQSHAVMVSGKLKGVEIRGVALSGHMGSSGAQAGSGVHVFIAPKDIYEALGGHAIIIVRWLLGTIEDPNTNMLETYGRVSPEDSVGMVKQWQEIWITQYLVPLVTGQTHAEALSMGATMQIHNQTMNMMQSYGTAQNDCAYYANCDVVPNADGTYRASPN